jgi:hypothetical protein
MTVFRLLLLKRWPTGHFAVAQRRVSPYHNDVYCPTNRATQRVLRAGGGPIRPMPARSLLLPVLASVRFL